MNKSITLAMICVATLTFVSAASAQPLVVAGWDDWSGNGSGDYNAPVTATDVFAQIVLASDGPLQWNVSDGRGASNDGDWGTFDGNGTAASLTGGDGVTNVNLELPNATTGGSLTITVDNNGTTDIDLSSFHFDSYAFRPKAARTYELSVLAGGAISEGVLYTSGEQEITHVGGAWDNGAHDDLDFAITGDDTTLEAGGSASFLLAFSGGAGDGSGGHDLWIDNLAIASGVEVSDPAVPGDFTDDGLVNDADIDALSANLGLAAGAASDPLMDIDPNGTIDLTDHDLHITNLVQDANGTGALIGDLNFDGDVDVSQIVIGAGGVQNFGDASVLLASLGQTSGQLYADGDLNGDGDVDVSEIVIGGGGVQNLGDASRLLANLGQTTVTGAPAASAVPEPGSIAILAIGGLGLFVRRRR